MCLEGVPLYNLFLDHMIYVRDVIFGGSVILQIYISNLYNLSIASMVSMVWDVFLWMRKMIMTGQTGMEVFII